MLFSRGSSSSGFFERQDKLRKEPLALKNKIFWFGVLIIFPAVLIEIPVDVLIQQIASNFYLNIFLGSFIGAAAIEEGLKFLAVRWGVYKNRHFDEVMDGITYAIIASLGFAVFENILYVLEGGN